MMSVLFSKKRDPADIIFTQKIKLFHKSSCLIFWELLEIFLIINIMAEVLWQLGAPEDDLVGVLTVFLFLSILLSIPAVIIGRNRSRLLSRLFTHKVTVNYYDDMAEIKGWVFTRLIPYSAVKECEKIPYDGVYKNSRNSRSQHYTRGFILRTNIDGRTMKLYSPPYEYCPYFKGCCLKRLYLALKLGSPIYEKNEISSEDVMASKNEHSGEEFISCKISRMFYRLNKFGIIMIIAGTILMMLSMKFLLDLNEELGTLMPVLSITVFLSYLVFGRNGEENDADIRLYDDYLEIKLKDETTRLGYSEIDTVYSVSIYENADKQYLRINLLNGDVISLKAGDHTDGCYIEMHGYSTEDIEKEIKIKLFEERYKYMSSI